MKPILSDPKLPAFHIEAPANSPIWGSADDMINWLFAWHEQGELTSAEIATITPELEFDVIADHRSGVHMAKISARYHIDERIVKYIIAKDDQDNDR